MKRLCKVILLCGQTAAASPKVSWPRMESMLLRLAGGETWATFSAFWCIRWLNSSVQSLMNFSLTTTVSLKTSAEACLLKGLSTC